MEERLLRAEEAAGILGLKRSKVYELIAANEIPSMHIGKLVRVPAQALQEWIRLKTDRHHAEAEAGAWPTEVRR